MPDTAAVSGVQGLTGIQVKDLFEELRAQYAGRNSDYQLARDRYVGKHWDAATNPAPTGRYSLTVNYIRPTVDKTVQMLVGKLPGIQVMPPGVDEVARRLAEAEEAILYATWDVNDAELVFRRIAHNMVLLRRGFAYYWWDPSLKRVRFRSLTPDNVYPVYDGEDTVEVVVVSRRLTRELQRTYPGLAHQITGDQANDATFDDARWTRVINGMADPLEDSNVPPGRGALASQTTVYDWFDRAGNWTRVMGDAVHTQNLGYGTNRVPVIEFVNGIQGDEREPRSDIEDIVELNQYLDQLISQQADVIRKYSNPTVIDYGSGQDPQTVKRTIQNSDGAVLPAKKDARIEYLNWTGTPADFEVQYQRVQSAIYDLSGKPASAYGQTVTNQSGVMTNLALSPTVATNDDKESVFGAALSLLNSDILRLYEKFMAGEAIEVRGVKPRGIGRGAGQFFEIGIPGKAIAGWYKNRIKWPSAMRTDDPVFVQNELQKMQSQPPVQSVYTTLENLGIEDAEAELDRIKEQLEDPRFHPEVLKSAIDAASALQGTELPADLEGLASGGAPIEEMEGLDEEDVNGAAVASASPHRDQLVNNEY